MDGSRAGLDYSGVQACFGLCGVRKPDRQAVFASLQAMEYAALQAWSEKTN